MERLRLSNKHLAKGVAATGEAARKVAEALWGFGHALNDVYYKFVLELYALPFGKKR